jgi:hypothetical protein
MDKETYLNDRDVASFIDWLTTHIRDPKKIQISNKFTVLRPNADFSFDSLQAALTRYQWGSPSVDGLSSFDENERVLSLLQEELKDAFKPEKWADLKEACIKIFRWGGVTNGNNAWAEINEKNLLSELSSVKGFIEAKNDDVKSISFPYRFNAGLTKVYSLLLPNFVIYDSRVAATLAWLVVCWSEMEQRTTVPENLRFTCMSAKEGKNAQYRKKRNPDPQIFPSLNNRAALHLQWNMRASWIVESVAKKIEGSGDLFSHQKAPMRAIEAAMFMWGYDLTNSKIK